MEENLWEVAQPDQESIRELMAAAAITRPTALVLAHRGIGPDNLDGFLRPALQSLSDPFALPGIVPAAERLWDAIQRGQRILIHGDYDTDGITAAVLLAWTLGENGASVSCFLPHRFDDGYGLTPDAVDKACRDGFQLMVTVDCGITGYEAAHAAQQQHLDLIVTDHHLPGNQPLPAAAVVDPKLPGADPRIADLAGVGVAFKLCHGFLKYGRQNGFGGQETDLRLGLDLVALGTVADIVPLLNENRLLVKHGLSVLSRQQRPGIRALCEMAGVADSIRTADITYKLAPRLNAAGRLGDPTESLRLLESTSMVDAAVYARSLEDHNRRRQQIEEESVSAAESQIASRYDLTQDRAIVVWDDRWHQGVLGIMASRLVRRYHRPCVVLTRDGNGHYTGSARSVRRLDLVQILEKCSACLTRFGGHVMAAGLSLESGRLQEFCRSFEDAVRQVFGLDAMRPQLEISGEVSFAEITDGFFSELEHLEPFGHSNPEPVFISRGVIPERRDAAGVGHTRGILNDGSGRRIGFIAFGRQPNDFPAPPWNLVYTPQINRFAGQSTPQVRVLDVRSEALTGGIVYTNTPPTPVAAP